MRLTGFAPPTDGCGCDICRVLRSHGADAEYNIEQADTLPPANAVKKSDVLTLDEIRAALEGKITMWDVGVGP